MVMGLFEFDARARLNLGFKLLDLAVLNDAADQHCDDEGGKIELDSADFAGLPSKLNSVLASFAPCCPL